jgi:hypothetical protein
MKTNSFVFFYTKNIIEDCSKLWWTDGDFFYRLTIFIIINNPFNLFSVFFKFFVFVGLHTTTDIKFIPPDLCKYYHITKLDGLDFVWLPVSVSRRSRHFEEINFAVTQRMTRLQLPPTNTNMTSECLEHFYPTSAAATSELGTAQ